ncbi:MAG: energy transducer TonB [Hydrogenophilales bacterium 17-64-34]|nr:MAG: energy transducer TonB [Hydrogenophilales bacterium 16-64-40]OZA36476.1 MAG: energy transducer TonB [Hydrogenophilales bacterium 17-64-34]
MEWDRAAGLLMVVALHGAVLYGLWSARVLPPPTEAVTLFVSFINPPPQSKPQAIPPPEPPKPVKREAPRPPDPPHYHLAAQAPVMSPQEAVEPLPPPEPALALVQAPSPPAPPAPPKPTGPLTLTTELAVACPDRTPPAYPPMARRLGETGKVVLRVELDETGRVSAAQVLTSSGSNRLDAAALAAVRTWRCHPAQRDGQAVRSLATQPFNFTLEGR